MSTDYDELSCEGFDEFGDTTYGDHQGFFQPNEFPTSEDELTGVTHMGEASRFNYSQRLNATTVGTLAELNMEPYKSNENVRNVRKTNHIKASNRPPISRNTCNKAHLKKQKLDLAWEKFSSLDQYLQDEVELEYRLICSQLEQSLTLEDNSHWIYVEIDEFYSAALIRDRPELADKPVAVANKNRVFYVNRAARERGVRPGHFVQEVRTFIPAERILQHDDDRYCETQKALITLLRKYDPEVEYSRSGEAKLEVSAYLSKQGADKETQIAKVMEDIVSDVKQSLKLQAFCGYGSNIFLSKLASVQSQSKYIAHHGSSVSLFPRNPELKKFSLSQFSLQCMPEIGPVTYIMLELMNIRDTEDLRKNLFKLYLFYGGKQDFVTLACICLGYGRSIHKSSSAFVSHSESVYLFKDHAPTKQNLTKKIRQMNASLMKEASKLQLTCQRVTLIIYFEDLSEKKESVELEEYTTDASKTETAILGLLKVEESQVGSPRPIKLRVQISFIKGSQPTTTVDSLPEIEAGTTTATVGPKPIEKSVREMYLKIDPPVALKVALKPKKEVPAKEKPSLAKTECLGMETNGEDHNEHSLPVNLDSTSPLKKRKQRNEPTDLDETPVKTPRKRKPKAPVILQPAVVEPVIVAPSEMKVESGEQSLDQMLIECDLILAKLEQVVDLRALNGPLVQSPVDTDQQKDSTHMMEEPKVKTDHKQIVGPQLVTRTYESILAVPAMFECPFCYRNIETAGFQSQVDRHLRQCEESLSKPLSAQIPSRAKPKSKQTTKTVSVTTFQELRKECGLPDKED